jgi:hypothetical protein
MGVNVDESRGDYQPARVYLAFATTGYAAQCRYLAILDGNISHEGGHAGAIDDASTADNQIVLSLC